MLALKVTPLITPDNRLILDINVKKDRVGQVVVTTGGVNVPSIDTSELTTTVFIGDGQTVVLGGILETERRENEKKVPCWAISRAWDTCSSPPARSTTRMSCSSS